VWRDVLLQSGRRRAQCAPAVFALRAPTVVNGVKSVVVNTKLREIEPMAFHFVREFAKDNDLQIVEACFLPPPKKSKTRFT
jgi:hypothetical protein